jgi:hypothetical protein
MFWYGTMCLAMQFFTLDQKKKRGRIEKEKRMLNISCSPLIENKQNILNILWSE